MGGGGGNNSGADTGAGKDKQAETQMMKRMVQPFMGDAQGLLAQQLAKGGYGDLSGLLAQTYQPMNIGYVTDPAGNRQYSGAAFMNALRGGLDAQGIKAPKKDD